MVRLAEACTLFAAGVAAAVAPGCLYRRGSLPQSVIISDVSGGDSTSVRGGGDSPYHQPSGDAEPGGDPAPAGDPNVDLGPWTGLDGSDLGPGDVDLGGSQWGGGVSGSVLTSTEPSVAADASSLYVAWSDAMPLDPTSTAQEQNAQIVVKERTNTGWQQIGARLGGSGSASHAGHPALGVVGTATGGETLWVAWEDNASGSWQINAAKCDPANCTWTGADGATQPSVVNDTSDGAQARFPVLAITSAGTVWVAWEDQLPAGTSKVELSRWSASSGWTAPVSPDTGTVPDSYRPCITAKNSVYVGWQTEATQQTISVASYSGAWASVVSGVYSATHGAASACSLALDSLGEMLIAWQEDDGSGAPRVYLWTPSGVLQNLVGTLATPVDDGNGSSEAPVVVAQGSTLGLFWQQSDSSGSHWRLMGRAVTGLTATSPSPAFSTAAPVSVGLGDATEPTAVATAAGTVVAWSDTTSGNAEIYATLISSSGSGFSDPGPDGTAAAISGTASGGLGHAGPPSLTLDANDAPVVAWSSDTAPQEGTIELRADGGSGWVTMPPVPSTGGNASGPVVVVQGGLIHLAWMENADTTTANPTVYYSQLSATSGTWSAPSGAPYDTVANPPGKAKGRPLDLAVNATGIPTIAWQGGDTVGATSWDATTGWSSGTVLGPSTSGATRPAIADGFPDPQLGDAPVIAWSAGNLSSDVLLCAGPPATCAGLGASADASTYGVSLNATDPSTGNHLSTNAAVAVDSNGQPVVAWQDHASGHWQIYLRRWNNQTQSWDQLAGSATGQGLSGASGDAQRPSLAIDADDRPLVAWQDSSSGNDEIYLRRFNGSAWQELSGSAHAGGISKTTGASLMPSLAVSETRICVAWLEANRLAQQVVMRCLVLN